MAPRSASPPDDFKIKDRADPPYGPDNPPSPPPIETAPWWSPPPDEGLSGPYGPDNPPPPPPGSPSKQDQEQQQEQQQKKKKKKKNKKARRSRRPHRNDTWKPTNDRAAERESPRDRERQDERSYSDPIDKKSYDDHQRMEPGHYRPPPMEPYRSRTPIRGEVERVDRCRYRTRSPSSRIRSRSRSRSPRGRGYGYHRNDNERSRSRPPRGRGYGYHHDGNGRVDSRRSSYGGGYRPKYDHYAPGR